MPVLRSWAAPAGGDQQVREIFRQVPGIRLATDRVDAQRGGGAVRQRVGEGPQHAERVRDGASGLPRPIEAQQDLAKLPGKQAGEVSGLGCLHVADAKTFGLGELCEAIEQDGLADAAQPDRYDALAWASRERATDGHAEARQQGVAANERGGWTPGAGPKRFSSSSIRADLTELTADLDKVPKLGKLRSPAVLRGPSGRGRIARWVTMRT